MRKTFIEVLGDHLRVVENQFAIDQRRNALVGVQIDQILGQVIGIDIDDFDGNPLLSEHHPHAVTLRTGCIGKQRHHRTAIGDYSHDFLH